MSNDLETIYEVHLPVKGWEIYQVFASNEKEALSKVRYGSYLHKELDIDCHEENGNEIYILDTKTKGDFSID